MIADKRRDVPIFRSIVRRVSAWKAFCAAVAIFISLGAQADEAKAADERNSQRRALLIGCGAYPHLPEALQLRGPANDVRLLHELLISRLGFAEADIAVLADDRPESQLPSFANIEREFKRLGAEASSGEEVLIYFSGHGTQQPDEVPADVNDVEPDGLDEVLCTRDVRRITAQDGRDIPGGVVDDVLKRWLDVPLARGAKVWMILDCCHSGTAVRGDETIRGIPPKELVPGMPAGSSAMKGSRGSVNEDALDVSAGGGGLVVLYAAQSNEPTVEKRLPRSGAERKPHGLLTFTLAEVLCRGTQQLTYRELAERIGRRYAEDGRTSPSPWIEGRGADAPIRGVAGSPASRKLQLKAGNAGGSIVTAGTIDGLAVGAILAVGREGDDSNEAPLAHARVVDVGLWESVIEACAYPTTAPMKPLPPSGLCRVVEAGVVPTLLRLYVASDAQSPGAAKLPRERRWPAGIEVVSSAQEADLVLRRDEEGWGLRDAVAARIVGRMKSSVEDRGFYGELDRVLARQLRVRRLLSLATATLTAHKTPNSSVDASLGPSAVRCKLQPLVFETTRDRVGLPLDLTQDPLRDGTIVAFEVANHGDTAVDVTLLVVSADGELQPLYPSEGREGDARLPAGKTLRTPRAMVEAMQSGTEHLLLIAVPASGAPRTFTWTADEPDTWKPQVVGAVRAGTDSTSALVREALLGKATTRGAAGGDMILQKISWRVRPRE